MPNINADSFNPYINDGTNDTKGRAQLGANMRGYSNQPQPNKEALTIAHAQWLSQPETQSFLKNLHQLQSDLCVKASNLALNTCSEDTTLQIRALLVSAARTQEIILYATKNIESITRHG